MKRQVRELQQKQGGGDSDIGAEKPLTDDEQAWLEREDVKRALAIVRESSRSQLDAIRPSHNLELDLGLDSMQRIELLTALEQQLGGEVPEAQLAEIYSVRELIDAILASAGRGEGQARAATPAMVDHPERAGHRSRGTRAGAPQYFCRSLFLSAGKADLSFRA